MQKNTYLKKNSSRCSRHMRAFSSTNRSSAPVLLEAGSIRVRTVRKWEAVSKVIFRKGDALLSMPSRLHAR